MAKENSDGEFRRIGQVKLCRSCGMALTSNFSDLPSEVIAQLTQPQRLLLSQSGVQIMMDYTGQIFFKRMSGLDIFEQIRRGGGQNGK